ncbi:MAG: hypothetical protein QGH86_02920 [SAR324 cluster bacterium]|nr:hypothetical protein [SAR324 cluster bacterium]
MMLFIIHVVAIGTVIGVTAHFAFSLGKKDGLRIARREQELKTQKEDPPKIASQ